LNLSGLKGYETGGTIHIIVNNQVGFTTDPDQARSTLYASDLAKGFEIPIVHVNADDPEACLAVARLALAYRNTFQHDFLIDLVGYRRWGHNETDEPSYTQPELYAEITNRPTVRALFASRLENEGALTPGEGDRMLAAALDRLHELKMISDGEPADGEHAPLPDQNGHAPGTPVPTGAAPDTGVAEVTLRAYNDALHSFPEDFTLNPKLERQLQRRRGALDRPGGIDWGQAESLAFASIVSDGTPIRLTGQDVERGTFVQRHLVLHDPHDGKTFTALQTLPSARASFEVHNSPLSEAAVLGFEYGYSVYAPEVLVLWEAQFGDFANSAQVIIDQFIAAAQAKWLQTSSLVMLLPHGYEGQGPEHSSARLERFLQLAANGSLTIANCTTSAQYFHLLRRQAASLRTYPRPLVVFTPKSLLRHPMAGSSLEDLVDGRFQEVIDDASAAERRGSVSRLVMCCGKVYVDIMAADGAKSPEAESTAVVRLEQPHPFPAERIAEIVRGYPGLRELVWVQEEPRNMGAWRYVADKLEELVGPDVPVRYDGRPERASPAEGSGDAHAEEQARITAAAWAGVRAPELSVTGG
jgi:2-oxoglutarate dehydrogenase E1 component